MRWLCSTLNPPSPPLPTAFSFCAVPLPVYEAAPSCCHSPPPPKKIQPQLRKNHTTPLNIYATAGTPHKSCAVRLHGDVRVARAHSVLLRTAGRSLIPSPQPTVLPRILLSRPRPPPLQAVSPLCGATRFSPSPPPPPSHPHSPMVMIYR